MYRLSTLIKVNYRAGPLQAHGPTPAAHTKLVFLVAGTDSARQLLLPSGMHTKKLERYRED